MASSEPGASAVELEKRERDHAATRIQGLWRGEMSRGKLLVKQVSADYEDEQAGRAAPPVTVPIDVKASRYAVQDAARPTHWPMATVSKALCSTKGAFVRAQEDSQGSE
eukprot:COSAG01_NODE_1751_length_9323_cov_5.197507_7_plen_109_part_00